MSAFFTNELFKTRYEQVLLLSALTAYPQRTLHLWPHSRINSFCQLSIFQLLLQTYQKYSHCPLGLPVSLFPSMFPCKMFFLKPSLISLCVDTWRQEDWLFISREWIVTVAPARRANMGSYLSLSAPLVSLSYKLTSARNGCWLKKSVGNSNNYYPVNS